MSTNERLHFLIVEETLDNEHVDDTGEALLETGQLTLTLFPKLEINVHPNELFGILLCDGDIRATLLQLYLINRPKLLHVHSESSA